jgi:hypothetical protein
MEQVLTEEEEEEEEEEDNVDDDDDDDDDDGDIQGFFVGVSLEAGLLVSRPDVNEAFYGMRVNTIDLLMGRVPPPKAGEPLYNALKVIIGSSGCNEDCNPESISL